MYTLATVIHCLFPLIAIALLIIGIKKKAIYYVISSLWLSLISLIIHFQASGGQILGSYFNYFNASIYTLNLLILFASLMCVISHLSHDSNLFRYLSSLAKALILIGTLLVITNIWINAYFIENRMTGTPIMQVALFKKPEYCGYRYIFYRVDTDGSVDYLCPNHYGFIPSLGHLTLSPDFIANQLPTSTKKEMLMQQKNKS